MYNFTYYYIPMVPIEFELTSNNVWKLTNDELMVAIQEAQKRSLLDNLDTFKKEEKSKQISQFSDTSYESLLNKPNMTATDKENMEKSIKYLVDNKMDTSENLKKLDAIKYGANFIEIGGVKFSREKLVPQVEFKSKVNQYDVFESNKKWICKTNYNGKDEYYLSTDAYIKEAKKQGKKAIKDDHIRNALQELPGEFKDNNWYQWANILWNILNLSMSGCVLSDGGWWDESGYGFLSSASPVITSSTRAFEFSEDRGGLSSDYNRDDARPCLFVVE